MKSMKSILAALLLAAGSAGAASAEQRLNGAGATFPFPIYSKWFDAYNKKTGVKINYQAIGSGGGIRQVTKKTVDFGASDGPMNLARTRSATTWPRASATLSAWKSSAMPSGRRISDRRNSSASSLD